MEEHKLNTVTADGPKKYQVPLSTVVLVVILTGVVGFILGTRAYLLPSPFARTTTAPSRIDLTSLNQLYATLREKYDGELDVNKLVDGAKHGMIDAAGDPYTVYFNAEEAKEFDSDLNGTFEGIGAELGKIDGKLTVMAVLGDSPAQASGLVAKDTILKINDEDATALTIGAAVKKIRGAKGTSVKLTILRADQTKDYTITRDTISSPSVKSEILDGNIGYMQITRFGDDTVRLARTAAEEFKQKGVKGVVLDLRGNGGGLLSGARDVSSLWLNDKVVVSERTNGVTTNTLRSGNDAVLAGIKTVVLVDAGSASASEIVAGALKDNGAATLVGEKTFGKGSVQVVEDIGDGSQLKVTIARWYTPNGKNINKEGIKPDKEVKATDADVLAGKDVQKETALAELR